MADVSREKAIIATEAARELVAEFDRPGDPMLVNEERVMDLLADILAALPNPRPWLLEDRILDDG